MELNEDENYIIKTKVCKRLSKELWLNEIVFDDKINYIPPKENGLSNSDIIIYSKLEIYRKFTVIFQNVCEGKYQHIINFINIHLKYLILIIMK